MSSSEGEDPQSNRPISVAELLARNGSIGAPPAGGHRRRRRGNRNAVTVAELTAEIPVVRDDEPPATVEPEPVADVSAEISEDAVVEIAPVTDDEAVEEAVTDEPVVEEAVVEEAVVDEEAEPVVEEAVTDEPVVEEAVVDEEAVDEVVEEAVVDEEAVVEEAVVEEADEPNDAQPEPDDEAQPTDETSADPAHTDTPPLASDPLPRRGDGPERSHDPRPVRRSAGAEQMAYDPVDESVNLDDLVSEAAGETEALRSYLKASGGTLFSGGTVADDMARRGAGIESEQAGSPASTVGGAQQPGRLAALRTAAVAAMQSVLAVAFGAGLFIGFDQLWRWNTIVALVLSVLVILGLVVAVRIVRRTEDIASTLIAVAVGALVTLGPLALLQSYG
jgi:hypothetical protein